MYHNARYKKKQSTCLSVCLSVRTAADPPNGLSWSFILRNFTKLCRCVPVPMNLTIMMEAAHEFCQHLGQLFLKKLCNGYNGASYTANKSCIKNETFYSQYTRGELSYLAPLGSEIISAPYFKQCFFQGGGLLPPDSQTPHLPVPRQK